MSPASRRPASREKIRGRTATVSALRKGCLPSADGTTSLRRASSSGKSLHLDAIAGADAELLLEHTGGFGGGPGLDGFGPHQQRGRERQGPDQREQGTKKPRHDPAEVSARLEGFRPLIAGHANAGAARRRYGGRQAYRVRPVDARFSGGRATGRSADRPRL